MALIGRRRELAEVQRLLDHAAAGSGGVLVLAGPSGSGRTALATAAAEAARQRGFGVHRAAGVAGRPGRWAWAKLLRDIGAQEQVVSRLLADPGPLDLDNAAAALCAAGPRLLVVDDADRAGPQATELVALLAGRAVTGQTAVLVTAAVPLGAASELWLGPLTPAEIGELAGERRPEVRLALWAAARGMPGRARSLAAALAALPPDGDPVVQLALLAESAEGFLDIDTGLVRLLETALHRVAAQDARARLLARLARALLGDAAAAGRRRELVADALALARRSGDPAVLAEVLDARLHALWDPAGAGDRLSAAAEIVELARASADLELERRGLFWRFVALMELGQVSEAESALAAFEREARAAGDAADLMMVTARHAMLATVRGRFADAHALIGQVAEQGRQAALPDTDRLVGTLRGAVAMTRGDPSGLEPAVAGLRAFARRVPGHFHDATIARVLLAAGQTAEADLELQRALPQVLAGSGPRWLGAAADLAAVAAGTGNAGAAARLYDALAGYQGRLVVWAGANSVTGPVSHFLGILAAQLGRPGEAAGHLADAAAMLRDVGALPLLAWTQAALAGVLSQRGQDGDARAAAGYRRQASAIAGQLGMPGLLATLPPPTPAGPVPAGPGPTGLVPAGPADEWTLRRDGQDWLLTAGAERARLRDSRGLHYLRALLAAPGREITALDLVAGGAGLRAAAAEPVLDNAARDAYRRRLADLAAELDAADQAGDAARAGRAEDERQAVLAELSRATGLGGRPRGISAAGERARVNVTRTLRAAIGRITDAAPAAGAHLAASVRTGQACRYQPAPGGPARWRA